MRPDTLELFAEVVLRRASGELVADLPEPAAVEAASAGERVGRQDVGRVAVLPVRDVIVPRHNLMTWLFGGTSLEELSAAIDEAVADPDISAIVLDVDSPGGSVDGLTEFAQHVRSVRDMGTPIVAHADYLMASAAYYIAAQAHQIVAAPSALVGSVGTIAVHRDWSRAWDDAGVTNTIVVSDPRKAQTHPLQPLSDDGRAEIQAMVDHYYGLFVNDVAKGRGITASKVLEDFGGGTLLLPNAALKAGMVDRIESIQDTVARVGRGARRVTAARAEGGETDITDTYEFDFAAAEIEPSRPTATEPQDPPVAAEPAAASDEDVLARVAAITRTPEERLAAAAQLRSH